MTKYLTYDQDIEIHDEMIKKFGGLPWLRDWNLLLSSIEAPKWSFDSKEVYSNLFEKAAVCLYHIVKNRSFNDANKRTI
jgi:death-on-curing protein